MITVRVVLKSLSPQNVAICSSLIQRHQSTNYG